MDGAKITFFMPVTNRDALIADYCVKSYQSLHDNFKREMPFVLYIYCNCLDSQKNNGDSASMVAIQLRADI